MYSKDTSGGRKGARDHKDGVGSGGGRDRSSELQEIQIVRTGFFNGVQES